MPKKLIEGSSQNIIQSVLVLLLIVAAFFIGFLWNKVQTMEDTGGGPTAGANAPTAPSQPEAPSAEAEIVAAVQSAGVNLEEFNNCMEAGDGAQVVNDQFQAGQKAGVRGTPGSYIIDKNTGDVHQVPGAVPLEQLASVVDSMLDGSYEPAGEHEIEPMSSSDHVRGDANARFVLVEYSDYDCSYCARFHTSAKSLVEQYDGQVAWVYRHFPLDSIHPNARTKAEAAECVAQVGGTDAFWKYSDIMLAE